MEPLTSFIGLAVLILIGAFSVTRARRLLDETTDRRASLESLAGMCQSGPLTADERRAVKAAVEMRLQDIG